ncbi:hypothetical protein Q6375_04025 [Clostridium septicum]|uniref:hypothetical protein n=1 Tax=Clostridium septicum TaxID=1504 RepID=UPI00272E4B35|nr:hypothetical protein [Clostridium septicum]WLF70173.1 hypothetical protein Q6375_04025 [Clostridium septicum]
MENINKKSILFSIVMIFILVFMCFNWGKKNIEDITRRDLHCLVDTPYYVRGVYLDEQNLNVNISGNMDKEGCEEIVKKIYGKIKKNSIKGKNIVVNFASEENNLNRKVNDSHVEKMHTKVILNPKNLDIKVNLFENFNMTPEIFKVNI